MMAKGPTSRGHLAMAASAAEDNAGYHLRQANNYMKLHQEELAKAKEYRRLAYKPGRKDEHDYL